MKKPPKSKLNKRVKPRKTQNSSEIWYRRKLVKIARELQKLTGSAMGVADLTTEAGMKSLIAKLDKLGQSKIDELSEKLASGFLERAKKNHDEAFIKMLKSLVGVDVTAYLANTPTVRRTLKAFTKTNIELIKSIPEQYLNKIKILITRGVLSGKSNEQIANEIYKLGGITQRRAKFIARDQAAKFNGAMEQAQQQDLGINSYRWSTSRDNRVRHSHQANEGKIFRWDDPPKTGHPGQDYNCRCVAIPIINLNEHRR